MMSRAASVWASFFSALALSRASAVFSLRNRSSSNCSGVLRARDAAVGPAGVSSPLSRWRRHKSMLEL